MNGFDVQQPPLPREIYASGGGLLVAPISVPPLLLLCHLSYYSIYLIPVL